jgi:hypothetical protein
MQNEEFQDADLAELERQIAALDGDDVDLGPPVKGGKATAKAPSKKKLGHDEIDLDDLDALEKQIAQMSDEEEESNTKPKVVAPAPAAPKPQEPEKTQAVVIREAPLVPHGDVDEGLDEPKDENGVPESTLMEEEPVYHGFQKIVSIDTLTHEEENYIGKIIDGQLIGPDYRDILETERTERQTHIEKLMKVMQSERLSLADYLGMVQQALENQQELQKAATAKKASITTQKRIQKRIELMTAEIETVKQRVQENGADARTQPQNAAQPADDAGDKLPPVNKTNTKKADSGEFTTAKASSEMPPTKKQYMVSEGKLNHMSKLIIQNVYFTFYKEQAGAPVASQLVAKLKNYRLLFNDPYKIRESDYEEFMATFPPITSEMVAGCSAEERLVRLQEIEDEAMISIEQMKTHALDKSEYLPTVELIKYVKAIKGIDSTPIPQVVSSNIEKMWKGPFNKNVPENTLRIYLERLTGAASHRAFFLKLGINYSGNITTVDTPWVGREI